MSGVFVTVGKRTYSVKAGMSCTKRACSLFKSGVCDFGGVDGDWPRKFPCDKLRDAIEMAGLVPITECHFKEAK